MAKSKYREDFPQLAEMYHRHGLNDEQVAAKLGISHETYYQYQKKYSEFSEAIKKGKRPVDFEVENALLKSALGFEYEEVTQEIRQNDGKEFKKIIKTKKYYPPNVTAGIFWTVNRQPDRWRSVNKDIEFPGNFDDRLKEIAETISKSDGDSK